jgi:hypothetical protein
MEPAANHHVLLLDGFVGPWLPRATELALHKLGLLDPFSFFHQVCLILREAVEGVLASPTRSRQVIDVSKFE